MKKILIGVPAMDMCSSYFTQSLAMLDRVEDCAISFIIGSLVYDARNKICQAAIAGEFDYIFWLDSDMIFPSNTLEHMFTVCEEENIDILTGLAFRRRAPYTPCIFKELDRDENGKIMFEGFDDYPDNKVFEVAGCGAACMLMKTDVLFDIAGADGNIWFNPEEGAGEDTAFCMRARKHGYKIFCDSRVKLGHVGVVPITEDTFKGTRKVPK